MYFLLLWYIFEGGILGRLLLTLTVKYIVHYITAFVGMHM